MILKLISLVVDETRSFSIANRDLSNRVITRWPPHCSQIIVIRLLINIRRVNIREGEGEKNIPIARGREIRKKKIHPAPSLLCYPRGFPDKDQRTCADASRRPREFMILLQPHAVLIKSRLCPFFLYSHEKIPSHLSLIDRARKYFYRLARGVCVCVLFQRKMKLNSSRSSKLLLPQNARAVIFLLSRLKLSREVFTVRRQLSLASRNFEVYSEQQPRSAQLQLL